MKNLRILSGWELHLATVRVTDEERRITLEVLQHLRENDRRRLYAELGYSSLHAYCTQELKYSEAAAHRRISATRLLAEMPELEPALREGTLNVTTVSQAATFFGQEKREGRKDYSVADKREVLEQLENQSRAKCEKILAGLSPEASKPDRLRRVSGHETEIRMTVDDALMEKLNRLRELLSHQLKDMSHRELLEVMADKLLEKLDPLKAPPPAEAAPRHAPSRSRYIPRPIWRAVYRRDMGCCSYVNTSTGRRCESRMRLQVDHIKPLGLGGLTELGNLRLLCANHNQFAADQAYGADKMSSFRVLRNRS